jgi:glycosyltransferase involved in cell wall biosynthesis
VRLLILTRTMSGGTMGRAFSYSLLADALGWEYTVAAPKDGPIWQPLATAPFADHCRVLRSPGDVVRQAAGHDLIVALKPWPHTYGRARTAARRTATPMVLDIDDPDLERLLHSHSWKARLRHLDPRSVPDRRHPLEVRALARHVPDEVVLASNPMLGDRYGATVLPHARVHRPPGGRHLGDAPVVGFIGTHRPHKGLPTLRAAIAELADDGFRLVASGAPPPDARPWESWLETTTLADGLAAIDAIDVLALPSLDGPEARAQLPAKLIDGMISGRAVIGSDLPPVRWASGGLARLVPPGSVADLVRGLRDLAVPEVRQAMGDQLRQRALAMFTPEVLAPVLRQVAERSTSGDVPPMRPPRPPAPPSS